MTITLLYFARVRELAGVSEETVHLPEFVRDVAGLLAWLAGRGPNFAAALGEGARIRVAVNLDEAGPEVRLKNGDEVAIFPPVTGG